MILLIGAIYVFLFTLSYWVINGHSFDDPIFCTKRPGIIVVCLLLTPLALVLATIYCYCWGFKFRLRP